MTTAERDGKVVRIIERETTFNGGTKESAPPREDMDGKLGESNENVQKRFESLNNTIENMNLHFNNILKDNEEKYILAFNTYMYDVQKEIRILKKIVKEEKIKELKDEKVKKLQKELKWYINECLRLDNVSQFLKKEAEKWKRNSELMKTHMLFLEEKLAKLYEKAIQKENTEKEEREGEGKIENKSKLGNEKKENKKNAPYTKEGAKQADAFDETGVKIGEKDGKFESKLKRRGKTDDDSTYKELNRKITNLEKKLKKQININCSLQEKLTRQYIEKSQYEKLFVDCVQQIKKDMGKQTLKDDKEKYIEDNFSSLINESELSYFTKEEKKKLLISFFSSNDIIHFMKKNIFCKEKPSFDFHPKNSYPTTRMKYQKRSDISPFIL
ncbi:conserved Plasmodium protein, unknown function [Plasmodium ovale]|uniref:Uncharacterized protein n=2 Tax=Plasmodium ovale TaxID=36330 RepID=A0A1A8W3A0_PLAOA|nr:hypothetical protein, conserved [Plasmodium ovale curtisi]SBS95651.1 hypothetical protein, conserved [Plasmodium ovale curtisi]SCP05222.1 conserved Plasmodium protein, unknown function [Plasmodium ovale]